MNGGEEPPPSLPPSEPEPGSSPPTMRSRLRGLLPTEKTTRGLTTAVAEKLQLHSVVVGGGGTAMHVSFGETKAKCQQQMNTLAFQTKVYKRKILR